MGYDGNNYAIQHSPLFYVCFVAVMITATALMLGLFLLMVGRASQTTKRMAVPTTKSPESLDSAGPADSSAEATAAAAVLPGADGSSSAAVGAAHAA